MAFATTLNRVNRLVIMIVDQFSMTLILLILAAPVLFLEFQTLFVTHEPMDIYIGQGFYEAFVLSLYFNKDIFLGRSIGKRLLRFAVINKQTGEAAGPLRCLVRNLTLIFWPVEVILAMVNVQERLGDYMAGTKLVSFERPPGGKPNWVMMGAAVLIGMVFVYVVMMLPMIGIMRFVTRIR
jgi:hypothetical protein